MQLTREFARFQQHRLSTPSLLLVTMEIALLLAVASLVAVTHAAVPAVPTDRMAQFLQDKSSLEYELSKWKQSDAGEFAKQHGFIPSTSTKAAGGAEDEELRRFFLTKLLVEEAQATNPEAVFSTDTPFTLMTEDEFVQFVGASYQRGSGLLTAASSVAEVFSNSTDAPSTEKDWTKSGCVAGVKNQGQCGSCWAFAAIAALESAVCLSGGPLTLLSEQQLLDCDTASGACQGGFPGDALEFIQRAGGVCTEDDYPYVSGDSGDHGSCQTSSCKPEAVTIRKYKGGVVSSCTSTDLDHAVLAVGYGGGSDGSSPFFKIKNSWGTQWGEAGFIRLKRGAGTGSGGTCGVIGPKSVYPQL
ncbi:hypothetical protein PF011_g16210 [Phytophthora fragariae]|uniref:Peptidase C1A papain C-terminal domain-containing protein n=1 Tax=Phytophthora fragariae TaxID=53985 RepID=A0A6A3JKL9_9STRA|nr:hypothetical protein PF011_g16210 [Phytophthora fragariae]